MNKRLFYKPDFDSDSGRKDVLIRLWKIIPCFIFSIIVLLIMIIGCFALIGRYHSEDEVALAETSSISTGVEYNFSYSESFVSPSTVSSQWSSSWGNLTNSTCAGTILRNGSTFLTFSSVQKIYSSGISSPYNFRFYNNNNNYVTFRFHGLNSSGTFYLVLDSITVYINGSSVSGVDYNDFSFNFSSYFIDTTFNPGLVFNNFMLNCLSEPAVSLIPEISFVPLTDTNLYVSDWYNSADHQLYSHYYESIAVLCRLDNASVYTHNNINQISFKFDLLRPSGGVDVLYHSFDCAFIMDGDSYAYALIMLDSKFVTDSNISSALLYYQDTSNGVYEFDSTDLSYFTANYLLLSDYHINGSLSSYDLGYSDGMDADSTLLSVIWSTFSLPFKLLFGEYDAINDTYVGGLFNFRILGVDVRAFVLGLLSFAVILAILRLLLGSKT